MKFKKANVSNILSYVMLFTLFMGFMIAMLFNNIMLERRSFVVDSINKVAMTLQSDLNGYSTNPDYCFMYSGGNKLNASQVNNVKNTAITKAKDSVKSIFSDPRNAHQLTLDNVTVDIIDGGAKKDIARVKINVSYTASVRSPFNKEGGTSSGTSGLMSVSIKDTASRAIENPVRQKNI